MTADTNLSCGGQNEYGRIKRIVLKRPEQAFVAQSRIDKEWEALRYHEPPRFAEAVREYDQFLELLSEDKPGIQFLDHDSTTGLDSIYCRDAAISTNHGLVLCNMGKPERATEPEVLSNRLKQLDLPILGRISGEGRLEGGDVAYLDQTTLIVGRGYRTNAEGIRQLRQITRNCIDEILVVPLPHYHGPDDVFHLMSFFSPLDHKLAAVYSPLMPVPFREFLLEREVRLVEVPDEEFPRMACNILALSPSKVIMLDGNPVTKQRLAEAGVTVITYKGDEISRKGEGGPTCLTRPIWRE